MRRYLFLSLITIACVSGCGSEAKTDAEAKLPVSDLGEEAIEDPGAAMLDDLDSGTSKSDASDSDKEPAAGDQESSDQDSTTDSPKATDQTPPAESGQPQQKDKTPAESTSTKATGDETFIEIDRDEEDE